MDNKTAIHLHRENTGAEYPVTFIECTSLYFSYGDEDHSLSKANFLLKAGRCYSATLNRLFAFDSRKESAARQIKTICDIEIDYIYEIVNKYNGVYGIYYFTNRITDNLQFQKPVIAKTRLDGEDWSLITGYDPGTQKISIKTSKNEIQIDSWYEVIDRLVFLGDRSVQLKSESELEEEGLPVTCGMNAEHWIQINPSRAFIVYTLEILLNYLNVISMLAGRYEQPHRDFSSIQQFADRIISLIKPVIYSEKHIGYVTNELTRIFNLYNSLQLELCELMKGKTNE